MNGSQGAELALAILSLAVFIGYHIWHYCLPWLHFKGHFRVGKSRYFNADQFTVDATRLWTHAFGKDHKASVAAVQTVTVTLLDRLDTMDSTLNPVLLLTFYMLQLRNALMVCTLFATAIAYIGARALPTVFLDEKYSQTLFKLTRIDPITGGAEGTAGLVSPQIKGAISFCIALAVYLCLAQATRYLVHVGFMVKIMMGEASAQREGEAVNYEVEVMAIMAQAQLTFSLGLRGIIAFGLTFSYYAGPTTLFVTTCIATFLIAWTDHLEVIPYKAVYNELDELAREQRSPEELNDKDNKYIEIRLDHEAAYRERHQD